VRGRAYASAVDRDGIAELAAELGFGDIAERLADLALPSVRLRCVTGGLLVVSSAGAHS
jgi:hypothetical protein